MLNLLGTDPSGYSMYDPKVTSCNTLGLVLKQNTFKISHMFNPLSTTVIQHKTHKLKQRKTSRKESVNIDGQKFNQYQQNKGKNVSSRKLNIKKIMAYDVRNPGPGLGQAL